MIISLKLMVLKIFNAIDYSIIHAYLCFFKFAILKIYSITKKPFINIFKRSTNNINTKEEKKSEQDARYKGWGLKPVFIIRLPLSWLKGFFSAILISGILRGSNFFSIEIMTLYLKREGKTRATLHIYVQCAYKDIGWEN